MLFPISNQQFNNLQPVILHTLKKEENSSFYFFFILSVYISSTARDFRHSSSTARIFGHSRAPSRLIARLFESGSSPRLVGQEKSPASKVTRVRCFRDVRKRWNTVVSDTWKNSPAGAG